jgi:solute carrier family 25 phosphate transporter 3
LFKFGAGGSEFGRIGISGAICASLAHAVLVPLDTVKIRLQTAPKGTYQSFFDATYKIMTREGGFNKFMIIFQPEIAGSALYGFFSFGGTELLRRQLSANLGPVAAIQYPIPILIFSSVLASTLSAVACTPFQAVKVRMVADDQFGPGGDMIGGLKRMVREDGWYSLVQGAPPYVIKNVLFVLSKFSVFDIVSYLGMRSCSSSCVVC